jgi:hypothetical protein
LQEEALTKIPGAFPGAIVASPQGTAKVLAIKSDGTYVAQPIKSKTPASKTVPEVVLKPYEIKLVYPKGFEEGDEVITVYGQGYVEKKRDTDVVVKLNDWALAQGQSPTCHLQPAACVKVPGLKVGQVNSRD